LSPADDYGGEILSLLLPDSLSLPYREHASFLSLIPPSLPLIIVFPSELQYTRVFCPLLSLLPVSVTEEHELDSPPSCSRSVFLSLVLG